MVTFFCALFVSVFSSLRISTIFDVFVQADPWSDQPRNPEATPGVFGGLTKSVAFFDILRDIRTMAVIGKDASEVRASQPTEASISLLERILGRRRPRSASTPRDIVTESEERARRARGYSSPSLAQSQFPDVPESPQALRRSPVQSRLLFGKASGTPKTDDGPGAVGADGSGHVEDESDDEESLEEGADIDFEV